MLIKYHDMFILATEVIKIIKERSALTIIINSDEKDSSADKLNLTAIKLCIELLLDHYFSNNDFYNDNLNISQFYNLFLITLTFLNLIL